MQITKLENGSYQILTVITRAAPDGSSYDQASIEIVTVAQLNQRLISSRKISEDTQSKIDAINALG